MIEQSLLGARLGILTTEEVAGILTTEEVALVDIGLGAVLGLAVVA